MNYYEKTLPAPYNHRAPCTMLDWLRMKEEITYLYKVIDGHVTEYERLVNDILQCREISVDGKRFFTPEVIDG